MFKSKADAVNKLIDVLDKNIISQCVVLAISNKGVLYAREIGLKNGFLEGDFLFIEKVKSPINKETTLAAISETKDYIIVNELVSSFGITDDFLFGEMDRIYDEKIKNNIYQLRGGESIISLKGKNVVLVDESVNTALRMLCAIKSCISQGVESINVAVPIISKEGLQIIEKLVDNIFFIKSVEDFVSTEYYFKEYK